MNSCICSNEVLRYPTNTPLVFHVETTWKRPFSRRFNVEYTWCVCWVVAWWKLFKDLVIDKTNFQSGIEFRQFVNNIGYSQLIVSRIIQKCS